MHIDPIYDIFVSGASSYLIHIRAAYSLINIVWCVSLQILCCILMAALYGKEQREVKWKGVDNFKNITAGKRSYTATVE